MKYLFCLTQDTQENGFSSLYTIVPIDSNTIDYIKAAKNSLEDMVALQNFACPELHIDFPVCYFSDDDDLREFMEEVGEYQMKFELGFFASDFWIAEFNLDDYQTEPFYARLRMAGDGDFRVYLANNEDVETVWVKADIFLAQGE